VTHPRPLLAAAAVVLAIGAGGCGDDSDEGPKGKGAPAPVQQTSQGADNSGGANVRSQKVTMLDYEFSPAVVTIATGGKITWTNQGQAPHDATADDDSFATPTIEAGEQKSVTFKEPGTFTYICTIHPQMEGTIEVVG
jgi:plastocyanin